MVGTTVVGMAVGTEVRSDGSSVLVGLVVGKAVGGELAGVMSVQSSPGAIDAGQ